jgi:DNA-binding HxlR family transcriptional regulator
VDYELTSLGSTLWSAIKPLSKWAQEHMNEIAAARAAFDARARPD